MVINRARFSRTWKRSENERRHVLASVGELIDAD
jgi:hypothetical protein